MADDAGKCIWGGCGRTARWQISILLWAEKTPPRARTADNCLQMVSSVTVCDECKANVKPEHFLLPEGREKILTGMQRAGRALPDFSTAAIDFVEIIDKPIDPISTAMNAKLRGAKIFEA